MVHGNGGEVEFSHRKAWPNSAFLVGQKWLVNDGTKTQKFGVWISKSAAHNLAAK
jgi:hypothetical protein